METLVPVVAKMLLGMETTPAEHLLFHQVLSDAFLNAGLGGDEAGGHDDGGFAVRGERVDDVLDEEQIDGHLVLVLVRRPWARRRRSGRGWPWCRGRRGSRRNRA